MLLSLIACATVTLTIPKAPEIDVERLLDCIAQVENWDGHSAGAAGEWGEFQMRPEVWQHCRGALRKTMKQATPSEHRTAAREELLFRMATLEINHVKATPYSAALAWTAGVAAVVNQTAREEKRAYAKRVVNLYHDTTTKSP